MENFTEEELDFSADDEAFDPDFSIKSERNKRRKGGSSFNLMKNSKIFQEKFLFNKDFYENVQQITDETTQVVNVSAKCSTCNVIVRATGWVTSNFVTHLRRKHPDVFEKYMSNKSKTRTRVDNKQMQFDELVLTFIVDAAIPISVIERESFKALFKGRGLEVMSRKVATTKLEAKFNSMIEQIKNKMCAVKNFCTTTDIWSTKHRSFLGYTCHWLDNNFKRNSVALACRRFAGKHSAERIAPLITEINNDFNLDHSNIVATVTDNGGNFVKAFKDYGVQLMMASVEGDVYDVSDAEEDLGQFQEITYLPKHERCASHTLNLLATKDFNKLLQMNKELNHRHTQVFKKCSSLWAKNNRPKSSEIIRSTLGSALIVPVITRWNSLFDAVSRLLLHEKKLDALCEALEVTKFSSSDLQYLHEYCELMSPICATLDYLQKEKNIMYGYLIPSLVSLSVKLRKIAQTDSIKFLKAVAVSLENKLCDRFSKFFTLKPEVNDPIAATVLIPGVKMRWFKSLQTKLPHLSEREIHNVVINEIETQVFVDINDCSSSKEPELKEDFFDFDEKSNDQPEINNGNRTNIIGEQLFKYLNDTDASIACLLKYPVLYKASLRFNTPLTSSAPVERLFSFAGIVNNPRRNALSDFSFEKLVLLKTNAEYGYKI